MASFLIVLVLGLAVAVLAAVQVRKIRPKIVGGKYTDISSVPYQVSLQFDNCHLCGGAIIRSSWILTAAHCVRQGTADNYTIRAGSRVHDSGGVLVQVSKIFRYPSYIDDGTNNFDAALLELKIRLGFNKHIRSIPFTETELKEKDLILISGWGSLNEHGPFSRVLHSTMVPVYSTDKCKHIYKKHRYIFGSMFCAGFPEGGKDACNGDSGGPAVFHGNLVGIVSFGRGCGRKNSPGVYINVTMIIPWIESQTG